MKILFWLFVAIDLVAIVIGGLLGLAAAGPSRTNPLAAIVIPVVIPGAILLGAVWVFLNMQSAGARALALGVAALPFIVVAIGMGTTALELLGYRDASGQIREFKSGALVEIEDAIARNDAAAVTAAARGAELNTRGISGASVLVLALRQLRTTPDQLDVIRALLAAGADPNFIASESPLQLAISASGRSGIELVRMFLDAGANPNAPDEEGEPAFFMAGASGVQVEVLQLLLARGADVQLRARDGESAVALPARTSNWPVLALLLRRGAPWQDQQGAVGVPFRDYVERELARSDAEGAAEVITHLRGGAAPPPS